MTRDTEQPWIESWPTWDEPLSKIPCLPAPIDIDAARLRLARRFNTRRMPKQVEIDDAWREHALRRIEEISR